MLLVVDQYNNVIFNHGINNAFPDGNVPFVEAKENQTLVRCKDNSIQSQAIMLAHEYTITKKLVENHYEVDTVTVIKTKEQYRQELENTNEYKRKELLKNLEQSDLKLIRIIDELTEFCETQGYKPNKSKKDIINERKLIRQQLEELGV